MQKFKIDFQKLDNKLLMILLFSALLVIIVLVAVLTASVVIKNNDQTKKTEVIEEIPVVVTQPVIGEIFEELKYSGNIEANQMVTVTPKASGSLEKIYVKVGDFVKKGDKLAEVEKEAALLTLEQAQAMFNVTKKEFQRIEKLFSDKVVTKSDYDKVKSQYDSASAQLRLAELNLKFTTITTPIDGVVVIFHTNQGQVVGPSSPIFTITDISRVKVKVKIPEKYYSFLKENSQNIIFYVKPVSYQDKEFKAKLSSISPFVSPESRTFEVEINITNSDNALTAGMFSEIRVIINYKNDALLIPLEALDSNNFIWILNESGRNARRVRAEIGIKNETHVEIKSGISKYDKIIIEGNNFIDESSVIKIVEGK